MTIIDRFANAIQISNEHILNHSAIINEGNLTSKHIEKHGSLNAAILAAEEEVLKFRGDFGAFTKLPEVTKDADELAYLAVVYQDFERSYHQMRGLAADVKSMIPVSRPSFESAFLHAYSIVSAFSTILVLAFGQSFYSMLEEAGN